MGKARRGLRPPGREAEGPPGSPCPASTGGGGSAFSDGLAEPLGSLRVQIPPSRFSSSQSPPMPESRAASPALPLWAFITVFKIVGNGIMSPSSSVRRHRPFLSLAPGTGSLHTVGAPWEVFGPCLGAALPSFSCWATFLNSRQTFARVLFLFLFLRIPPTPTPSRRCPDSLPGTFLQRLSHSTPPVAVTAPNSHSPVS